MGGMMGGLWILGGLMGILPLQYDIGVSLDTTHHRLLAQEEVLYVNTSEDHLPFLWFHLYPNAYQKTSIFAREAARRGDFRIHRAPPEDLGNITFHQVSLRQGEGEHTCEVEHILWENREMFRDFPHTSGCVLRVVDTEGQLVLPRLLLPGETLRIRFRFSVQIPRLFSRMGREGKAYFITQWYPKAVVYDTVPPKAPPLDLPDPAWKGPSGYWHPDGYHYVGEFYGAFARYTVQITVPPGYVVGATGMLVAHFSPDTAEHYTFLADSVHDFAWVASPDFTVVETTWQHVTLRFLITPRNAALYQTIRPDVPRMLERFSAWLGPYPYTVLTVVDGVLRAGGGMEYPTLILIGRPWRGVSFLRRVVAHEVAHQWFYGIWANNELDEAWLDESWTSWAEERWMRWWEEHHGSETSASSASPSPWHRVRALLSPTRWIRSPWRGGMALYLYRYAAGDGNEPVAGAPAHRMRAYFPTIYQKGMRVVRHLERYAGDTLFSRILQAYRACCAMRNVHIQDLYTVLEHHGVSPRKLLDPLLYHVVRDVRVAWARRTPEALTLRLDFDGPPVPVLVEGYRGEETLRVWADTGLIRLPSEVSHIRLDPHNDLLEANEWNNTWGGRLPPFRWGWILPPPLRPDELWIWGVPTVYYGTQGLTPGVLGVWTQGTVRHTGALYAGYGLRSRRGEGLLFWMERRFQGSVGLWQGSHDQTFRYTLRETSPSLHLTLFRERVFDPTYLNPVVYEPGDRIALHLGGNHRWRTPRWTGWWQGRVAGGYTLQGRDPGPYGRIHLQGGLQTGRFAWDLRVGKAWGHIPAQERFFLEGEGQETFPWSLLLPSTGDWSTTGRWITLGQGLGGFGGRGLAGNEVLDLGIQGQVRGPLHLYGRVGWIGRSRPYLEGGASVVATPVEVRFPAYLWPPVDGRRWRFRVYLRLETPSL